MACCSCSQSSHSYPKNPFLLTFSLLLRCSKLSCPEKKPQLLSMAHGSLPYACYPLSHRQLLLSICLYHSGPNLTPTWPILLFTQLFSSILNLLSLPSSASFNQNKAVCPTPFSESCHLSALLAQFCSSLLNIIASPTHTSWAGMCFFFFFYHSTSST